MNLTLNNFMAYILAITMVIQSYSKVFFASDTIFQNIFFYALVFFFNINCKYIKVQID